LCRRLKEQEKKVKGGEKIEVMIDGTDIETDIERFASYIHIFNILFFCFLRNLHLLFEDKTNSMNIILVFTQKNKILLVKDEHCFETFVTLS
jgi:hypothetical protein